MGSEMCIRDSCKVLGPRCGQNVARSMVCAGLWGPNLARMLPEPLVFAMFWGPVVASMLPEPWFLQGSGARCGQNVARTIVLACFWGPVVARMLRKPWFLHGSGAPSWPDCCQNHDFFNVLGPRCGQNVARTIVFAGFLDPVVARMLPEL